MADNICGKGDAAEAFSICPGGEGWDAAEYAAYCHMNGVERYHRMSRDRSFRTFVETGFVLY